MRNIIMVWLLVVLGACSSSSAPEVRVEGKTTTDGHQYTLFHPQGLAVRVMTTRPDVADGRYQLSVAAAYTDLDTGQPLDLLVSSGRVRQTRAKVGFLDGVLTLVGDSLSIARIPMGQAPARAELERVRRHQGTLMLQELLVFEGRNLRTEGGAVFQRRALMELAGHRLVVVESTSDELTMQHFADDLVELGARQALYLDMGGWDEGWYKTGSQVVKLGHRRTDTARQSNWLVFVKRD
ncbi:hypothetical protein Q5H92_05140 [Hymenobacter sp. M29]|uniref:Phosphodiester glycosidase domain-containing protein n=1 Tax=Hymenobacter mellowenesis TaxID=3063995 RepID=A0ABT9A881_9BACT|nr:hypothetical protein [Hymenobacter sp. M29]MDO7845733.1 hypothetical protein [Hymenobacter sp. M29]